MKLYFYKDKRKIKPKKYLLKASSFLDFKISLETYLIKQGHKEAFVFKETEKEKITCVSKHERVGSIGVYFVETKNVHFGIQALKDTVALIRNEGVGGYVKIIIFCFDEIPQNIEEYICERWEFSKANYISKTPIIDVPLFVDIKKRIAYIPNMGERKYLIHYRPFLKKALDILSPFITEMETYDTTK